jgi:hypothetical protein
VAIGHSQRLIADFGYAPGGMIRGEYAQFAVKRQLRAPLPCRSSSKRQLRIANAFQGKCCSN